MRESKRYEQLECVLSDDELKVYSKSMAEAFKSKEKVEAELQAFKSKKKGEVEAYDALVKDMSYKISSGKEFRKVECRVNYDWDNKEKIIARIDTGEIVDIEIISEHELQEEAELNAKESQV